MPTVTLSSKNQITLPAAMVRRLGLKGGDKIVAELIDDHIVLLPQPESWADYFAGSLKGVWGRTPEETDQYLADLRARRERDEWLEEFNVMTEIEHPAAKRIVEYLRRRKAHAATRADLYEFRDKEAIDVQEFSRALEALLEHGAVRYKKLEPTPRSGEFAGMSAVCYLVPEFVEPRHDSRGDRTVRSRNLMSWQR